MNDLIQLTDAEIAGVSGGILNQDISISASQSNSASVSQSASSSNSGAVSASLSTGAGGSADGATVAASGSSASNASLLVQKNSIYASNRQSFHIHI